VISGPQSVGETTPRSTAGPRVGATAPVAPAVHGDHVSSHLPGKYLALVELGARTKSPQTLWWGARPLSEAKNAHATNTRASFEQALRDGYNYFEGDVRGEINHAGRLEMRHDTIHESGDNLTLREWLELGKASGRGLKLDIKESEHVRAILDLAQEVAVPQDRLMFNLGYGAMDRWGDEIRKRFPNATLALNPPAGDGPLSAEQAAKMIAQARRFGGPVHFVVRYDLLGDDAIRAFKGHGPVSVWNSPFDGRPVKDAAATARELRARGVDGVIDIRKSKSRTEKARAWLRYGWNGLRTGWDRNKTKVTGFITAGADWADGGYQKAKGVAKAAWNKIF
jgi:hypothetical protein